MSLQIYFCLEISLAYTAHKLCKKNPNVNSVSIHFKEPGYDSLFPTRSLLKQLLEKVAG
jgi:hypothetical protein